MSAPFVDGELKRADELLAKQLHFAAVVCLHCLLVAMRPFSPDEKAFVEAEAVKRLRVVDRSAVRAALQKKAARLRRFDLSPAEAYEFEEMVLLLTIRIEIAAARSYDESLDLSDVDAQLLAVRDSERNRREYKSALRAIRANWFSRVPVDPRHFGIGDLFAVQKIPFSLRGVLSLLNDARVAADPTDAVNDFQEIVWDGIDDVMTDEITDVLRTLAHDLNYYVHDESLRAEDPSYYGEKRLRREIDEALASLRKLGIEEAE